ncbi:MAG TPA: hypothetical protein DHV36_25405 [Desulfobacteraceae bacterium]|nr:hypothetical protein [Desulfobacteraceae bacterium]|tara:strand:+ start:502 stop:756 length:255 start_codon:yes stop_codon:yes gene_type:complete
MLAKNIVGTIILILNTAGVGFVLYLGMISLLHHFFPKEVEEEPEPARARHEDIVIDEDFIPDEDDLLKDMDLSDLDNLNLDDFE